MIDYFITASIMLIVIGSLLYKASFVSEKFESGNDGFFDVANTKAMRGFWCVVVILVHIPTAYQNKVQDLIGSFAYIGVTFFFMTSAYGLLLSYKRNPGMIKTFWRKRLPKLLIPNFLINIFFIVVSLFTFKDSIHLFDLITINNWVRWLLGCYLAFLIGYGFLSKTKQRIAVITFVVSGSVMFYCLKTIGLISITTWTMEVYGFIWGLLLADGYEKIKSFLVKKWISKVLLLLAMAIVFGVSYLKFKTVLFFGDYVLKIVLGVIILLFILALNSRIKIGNNFIWFLRDISFEVYLIHGNVFALISRIFPNMSSGIFILCAIVLTVFISTLIHFVCKFIFAFLNGTNTLQKGRLTL